jgi:hypothetical protein
LLSFRDAHQDLSPASGLNATPYSAATVSTPVEDTRMGQCFFLLKQALAKVTTSSNNIHQRNGAWLLGRNQNQSLDIDRALVKIEAEEDGDGDSNCSAAKAGDLFSSVVLRTKMTFFVTLLTI